MKRLTGLLVGMVLGLGALASPASAEFFAAGELNDIFYTNRENLFDAAGFPKDPTSPAVGDHLIGILNVQNIDGVISGTTFAQDPFPAGGIDQISGVFAQKILAIVPGAGPTGETVVLFGNPTLPGFFDPAIGGFVPLPLGPGEMFKFFHDTGAGTPFETNGSMADDLGKAADGSFFLSFGLDATSGFGPDGLFLTPDDTGYVYSLLTTSVTGEQFGGVSLIGNGSGFLFDPLVDPNETFLTGFRGGPVAAPLVFHSTFALNAGFPASSPWLFSSNDPGQMHPNAIPEVSSLWMLGMGLSGFGIFRRRKWLV